MRSYFLLLLTLFIFISGKLLSQAKSYEAQWKKVDELIEKKNLPKSGLAEFMPWQRRIKTMYRP
jgi:hypothetical protein